MDTAARRAGRALPLTPIAGFLARLRAFRRDRAGLKALAALDDAMLKDIGLTRAEVAAAEALVRGRLPLPWRAAADAPHAPDADPYAYLRRRAREREARFG